MADAPAAEFIVGEHDDGRRLDRVVAREVGQPVARVQRAMRTGALRVDGQRVEIAARARAGARVRWQGVRAAPKPGRRRPRPNDLALVQPERVLYRDEALLVYDKPAGLAVHGGTGQTGTLVHGIEAMVRAEGGGDAFRPRPVHRIDRETSGLVIFALTGRALRALHAAFRAREVHKRYLAYALGTLEPARGEIALPLERAQGGRGDVRVAAGGRPATTRYRVLASGVVGGLRLCRLELEPVTGRRHQLRVHLAARGAPIVGDRRYGSRRANRALVRALGVHRLALHAAGLRLPHPLSGRPITLRAPEPPELSPLAQAVSGN